MYISVTSVTSQKCSITSTSKHQSRNIFVPGKTRLSPRQVSRSFFYFFLQSLGEI